MSAGRWCGACGAFWDSAHRFCGACGSPLADVAVEAGERRPLTVFFCDLVGSTELVSRYDAEDVRDILRRYHDVVGRAVDAAGGTVVRLVGDGVLAYFGYPVASADAAHRAVDCGLTVVRTVPTIRTDDLVADPLVLQCRVGVHSGVVYVGPMQSGARTEYHDVVGDTPNIAARLQSVAAPGQIVIGDSTHARIAGWFDCRSLGHLDLRGIPDPMPAFVVEGRTDAASRSHATLSRGPFVGRAEHLATLESRWRDVIDGRSRAVSVRGPAGSGKSRLVAEVRRRIADVTSGVLVLEFRGEPSSVDDPLHASRGVADRLPEPDDEATDGKDWFVRAADTLLAGEHDATILVVEEGESVDPSTYELLRSAHEHRAPTFVLVACRDETDPLGWTEIIDLDPLAPDEVSALAEALGADPEAVEQIVRASDGVPLFVEELASAASDDRGALSGTLHDLLVSRLDRCGASRQAALVASVAGLEFTIDEIDEIAPHVRPAHGHIAVLSERGVVVSGSGPGRWRFRHALLRDVAYEAVLRHTRRDLHARLARHCSRSGAPPTTVAHHHEMAGEAEDAVRAWRQAVRDSTRHGFMREALSQCERALACLERTAPGPERDARELRVRLTHLAAYQAFHDHADAGLGDLIESCTTLASRADSPDGHLLAIIASTYAQAIGDYEAAHRHLDVARDVAERWDLGPLVSAADVFRGCLFAWQGDHQQARPLLDSALSTFGAGLDDPPMTGGLPPGGDWSVRLLAAGLGSAAIAASVAGDDAEADQRIEQGLAATAAEEHREPRSMLSVSDAIRHQLRGRTDEARAAAAHAIEALDGSDSSQWEPWAAAVIGWADRDAAAIETALASLAPNAVQMRSYVLTLLADVLPPTDAGPVVAQARALMESTGEAFHDQLLQRIEQTATRT